MKTYKIESKFIHDGHECIVVFTAVGHRCGYVSVAKNSLLYQKDYTTMLDNQELLEFVKAQPRGKRGIIPFLFWNSEDVNLEILCDVHGGITYSGNLEHIIGENKQWYFGFDCAHLGDGKDYKALQKYFNITEEHNGYHADIAQTKNYVIQECKTLATQLTTIEACLQKNNKNNLKGKPSGSICG